MTSTTPAKYCSPKNTGKKFTCFTHNSLLKIAKAWNRSNPSDPIPTKLLGGETKHKKKLWSEISKKFSPETCSSEYCWISSKIIKGLDDPKITFDTFLPEKPASWNKKPTTWLSTTDIRFVLLQYESKYPEFEFIGPVPIDFDSKISFGTCVVEELCKINLEELYRHNKTKIGIVFNLDPHDMPGSHWVSLFCDLTNGGIYYFDSVGKYPVPEIEKLMTRLREQGNKLLLDGVLPYANISDDFMVSGKVKKVDSLVRLDHQVGKYLQDMPIQFVYQGDDRKSTTSDLYQITKVNQSSLKVTPDISEKQRDSIVEYQIKGFRLFFNDISHQMKNTECGIYSIFFITSILQGVKYADFTHNIVRDDEMNTNRDVFYRPNLGTKPTKKHKPESN